MCHGILSFLALTPPKSSCIATFEAFEENLLTPCFTKDTAAK